MTMDCTLMMTTYRGKTGTTCPKWAREFFGSRLASLVRQALNGKTEGRGCIVSEVTMLLPLLPPGEPLQQQMSLDCLSNESHRANHIKNVYDFDKSSYAPSREPGCWITSLKCLYTNAHSMGNKIELET